MWKLVQSYIVGTVLKLAGWRATLANYVLNFLYKDLKKFVLDVYNKMMDDKALKKYADELAKGKESDEKQKLQDQLDLLNPKHK